MLSPEGYNIIVSPGEKAVEHDTVTCCHCQWVGFMKPGLLGQPQMMIMGNDGKTIRWADAGFCRKCMRHTCLRPACNFQCTPVLEKVEAEEKIARQFLSAGS
jgi:hypothetical protein